LNASPLCPKGNSGCHCTSKHSQAAKCQHISQGQHQCDLRSRVGWVESSSSWIMQAEIPIFASWNASVTLSTVEQVIILNIKIRALILLRLLVVTGVVSLSSFSGFKFVCSFYDQFSNRHCCSLRQLLPWIMAFRCHFVMPLITTVQVPAILYVLRLPRDSVIGLFRRRYPSISLRR